VPLPGFDRDTVARAIRLDGRLDSLRLVALAGAGFRGDGKRFADAGFDGYFVKPVRIEELREALCLVMSTLGDRKATESRLVTRHTINEFARRFEGIGARILLAEDNPTNQYVALAMLRRLGLEADAVNDGVEAMNALSTKQYDLVLTDVQMPGMDGYELSRSIRDSGSRVLNHRIPIIAMTAEALKGARERCLAAGMNGYVSKPVSPLSLAEEIARWIPTQESDAQGRGGSDLVEKQDSDPTVWDKDDFFSRLMGDRELAALVVTQFLEDAPSRIKRLAQLTASDDLVEAGREGHALKGAAGNIGAKELEALARKVETAGKSRDIHGIEAAMEEIRDAYPRLENVLRNFLRNASGSI